MDNINLMKKIHKKPSMEKKIKRKVKLFDNNLKIDMNNFLIKLNINKKFLYKIKEITNNTTGSKKIHYEINLTKLKENEPEKFDILYKKIMDF
jgi:hypothetical protein